MCKICSEIPLADILGKAIPEVSTTVAKTTFQREFVHVKGTASLYSWNHVASIKLYHSNL